MQVETLWVGNDVLLRITGVRGAANGAYLNGASGSVTLVDEATGQNVAGQTWPATLSYVADSDGQYEGLLEDVVVLEDCDELRADVVIDGGAGLKLFIKLPILARNRSGSVASRAG